MNIRKLNEELDKYILTEGQLNEMALKLTDCENITEFRNKALNFRNGIDEREYIVFNGIRISTDTILHAEKQHPNNMSNSYWELFVKTFNPKTDENYLSKRRGQRLDRYMYKCPANGGKFFAYLLEGLDNKKRSINGYSG